MYDGGGRSPVSCRPAPAERLPPNPWAGRSSEPAPIHSRHRYEYGRCRLRRTVPGTSHSSSRHAGVPRILPGRRQARRSRCSRHPYGHAARRPDCPAPTYSSPPCGYVLPAGHSSRQCAGVPQSRKADTRDSRFRHSSGNHGCEPQNRHTRTSDFRWHHSSPPCADEFPASLRCTREPFSQPTSPAHSRRPCGCAPGCHIAFPV